VAKLGVVPFSDDDLDEFYREIEARTEAPPGRHRRSSAIPRTPGAASAGTPPSNDPLASESALSDDDLAAYYRDIEARTAAQRVRRRTRGSRSRTAVTCPTPDKEAFGAEVLAREGITRIRQRTGPRVPLRCYECVCGAWHITSKPPR
jgi:hypothetical protein